VTGPGVTGPGVTGPGVIGAGKPEAEAGERQAPFFCPYCGEEELRPAGSRGGDWECHACARAFTLRFTGVLS
jgi:hypothetical protein